MVSWGARMYALVLIVRSFVGFESDFCHVRQWSTIRQTSYVCVLMLLLLHLYFFSFSILLFIHTLQIYFIDALSSFTLIQSLLNCFCCWLFDLFIVCLVACLYIFIGLQECCTVSLSFRLIRNFFAHELISKPFSCPHQHWFHTKCELLVNNNINFTSCAHHHSF